MYPILTFYFAKTIDITASKSYNKYKEFIERIYRDEHSTKNLC